MENNKITIIGGGIGGLHSALNLAKNGFEVTLIERQKNVGGLSASIPIKGYKIDIGPHYMTLKKESEITEEIINLVGKENIIFLNDIEKSYLSYYNKKILKTVPTISDAIFSSGLKSILMSTFSLIFKPSFKSNTNETLSQEYLRTCFGNYLFEKWCKPYLLQNFGNLDLPLDYLKNRFKPITINKILNKLLYKSNRIDEVKIKKLDDKYINCYFKYGIGYLSEILHKKIKNLGVKIILEADIISIQHERNKKIVYKKNGNEYSIETDYIIYATPPTITKKWFDKLNENYIDKQHNKNYNSIMVFLFVDIPKIFDGWLISIFDKTIPFFRLSQQNFLSNDVSPRNKTLLTAEIRLDENSELWNKNEDEIFQIVKNNLKNMNLLNHQIDGYKIIKLQNLYPRFKSNIKEINFQIENEISKTKNEYLLGISELDTGRFASSEQLSNKDHVPSGGGIYNAISNSKRIADMIMRNKK